MLSALFFELYKSFPYINQKLFHLLHIMKYYSKDFAIYLEKNTVNTNFTKYHFGSQKYTSGKLFKGSFSCQNGSILFIIFRKSYTSKLNYLTKWNGNKSKGKKVVNGEAAND